MNGFSDPGLDCKFALLALANVRADIPEAGITLPDATRVLTGLPVDLGAQWEAWLGIEFSKLRSANLVLGRTANTGFSPDALSVCDQVNDKLAQQATNIFTMLRLLGTLEYESAFLLKGYSIKGHATCQQFSKLSRFEVTRGCLPWLVRRDHLASACDLAQAEASLRTSFPDAGKIRLFRGWWVLTTALQQIFASDRIHGFVRALEAVIYPQVGKTERQFVHRGSLFASPRSKKHAARQALEEAYAMRCDVEHVHDWDRSLTKHDAADREDIAYWRTRQMETLACKVYARIFRDPAFRENFCSDIGLDHFWQRREHEIRAAFGDVCDITQLNLVKRYDGFGRAQLSEWPDGWLDTLQRNREHA